MAQNIAEKIK